MYRLIAGDAYTLTDQDLALDAPTQLSLSSKWLKPEQAVTVGELVELVKADYLANQQLDDTDTAENKQSKLTLMIIILSVGNLMFSSPVTKFDPKTDLCREPKAKSC